jgi:hypothetical protein
MPGNGQGMEGEVESLRVWVRGALASEGAGAGGTTKGVKQEDSKDDELQRPNSMANLLRRRG